MALSVRSCAIETVPMGECEACHEPLPLADGAWYDEPGEVYPEYGRIVGERFCCAPCGVVGVAMGVLMRRGDV